MSFDLNWRGNKMQVGVGPQPRQNQTFRLTGGAGPQSPQNQGLLPVSLRNMRANYNQTRNAANRAGDLGGILRGMARPGQSLSMGDAAAALPTAIDRRMQGAMDGARQWLQDQEVNQQYRLAQQAMNQDQAWDQTDFLTDMLGQQNRYSLSVEGLMMQHMRSIM